MGQQTGIEWCDHTFNPWIGCTNLSAACDHCYAETLVHRYGWAEWGPGKPRHRTSAENWKQPLAWNRKAERDGVRRRVFCASLADVFDAEVLQEWRGDLFEIIQQTPHLDWLLLTKRPQVALKFFEPRPDLHNLPNVWLGTTVEDQKMAELRIPILGSIPAKVHFLSCEPLLGPIDIHGIDRWNTIDWIIAGGESGPKARRSHPDWMRSLRDQCGTTEIPFFFKQWGDWLPGENYLETRPAGPARWQDGETGQHSTCKDRPDSKTPEWQHWTKPGEPGVFHLRVGKKKAGAKLDGVEHREFPKAALVGAALHDMEAL